ncbi:MAG TPA: hypothetical protein PK593_00090 [Thermomicrobiales bacterium]|nr:hypothetical protein [Thermomicrobiales bacterium]HQZ90498.1 hypothetical protein [Thermomicrobiales bacterium]HRA32556.1 hypothetical protein [Thermomicrobiales bacterium]
MTRRPWTAADDALLRSLWGTDTPRSEIAAQLCRTQAAAKNRASKIGATNPKPPRWTREERSRLDMMLEQGMSYEAIARRLGRSVNAVILARKRSGLRPASRRYLNATQVAGIMGLSCSQIASRWIKRGYLRGKRGPHWGHYRQWQTTEEGLWAFIENESHWHRWEPEHITDLALREWALELRDGVRFLTTGEVAWRCCVDVGTVNGWIHGGVLPAVRRQNWLVRESDLEGFIPPNQRSKVGMTQIRFTPEEDARLWALRDGGATWTEIADALGRNTSSVAGRYQRLAEREAAPRGLRAPTGRPLAVRRAPRAAAPYPLIAFCHLARRHLS